MKKKILMVDDEAEFAQLLERAMPEYEFYIEKDGAKALTTARALRPHLILLDLVMPELAGLELVDLLTRDPRLCLTPLVLLSALVDDPSDSGGPVRVRGLPAFGKPFSIEVLRRYIAATLDESGTPPVAQLKPGTLAGD